MRRNLDHFVGARCAVTLATHVGARRVVLVATAGKQSGKARAHHRFRIWCFQKRSSINQLLASADQKFDENASPAMGVIASVLQWHCEHCSLINPTEQVRCIRCGRSREVANTNKDNDSADSFLSNFGTTAKCTVIRRVKSKGIKSVKRDFIR